MEVKKTKLFSELFTNNNFKYSFVLFISKQSLVSSKIGRKNHYLEMKSKIGRKNPYLEKLNEKNGRKFYYSQKLCFDKFFAWKEYNFPSGFLTNTILNFAQECSLPSQKIGEKQTLPSKNFHYHPSYFDDSKVLKMNRILNF